MVEVIKAVFFYSCMTLLVCWSVLRINFCFPLLLLTFLNKPASAWEMSSIIFFVLFLFFCFHSLPSSLSPLYPHPPIHHIPSPSPHNLLPPLRLPLLTTSLPPASTLFALCVKSPEPKGSESQPTPVTNKETLGSHLTAERLGGSVQVLLLLLLLLPWWLMHDATYFCMCLTPSPPTHANTHWLRTACLPVRCSVSTLCVFALYVWIPVYQCFACSVCSFCFIRLICCRLPTGRAMQRWHSTATVMQTS